MVSCVHHRLPSPLATKATRQREAEGAAKHTRVRRWPPRQLTQQQRRGTLHADLQCSSVRCPVCMCLPHHPPAARASSANSIATSSPKAGGRSVPGADSWTPTDAAFLDSRRSERLRHLTTDVEDPTDRSARSHTVANRAASLGRSYRYANTTSPRRTSSQGEDGPGPTQVRALRSSR